jgi:hypothetical protein
VDLSNVDERLAERIDELVFSRDVILRNGVVLQRGIERMQALKVWLWSTGYWADNGRWTDSAEPVDGEVVVHWIATDDLLQSRQVAVHSRGGDG